MLTLFTTPVVYLYFDRLQRWRERRRANVVLPAPRPGEA
jgi:multidrug efflux pump